MMSDRKVMDSEHARAARHFARESSDARRLGSLIPPSSGARAIINRIVPAAMANDCKHLRSPCGKPALANARLMLAPPTIAQGGGGPRPTLEPVDGGGSKTGRLSELVPHTRAIHSEYYSGLSNFSQLGEFQ